MINEKDVVISIRGRQTVEGDVDCMELTTKGTLSVSEGIVSICYNECLDETSNCITTLSIENEGKIVMTRAGEYTASMIIERGQKHLCHYETPYGSFMMGLFGESVKSELTERGGDIKFRYLIDINSILASANEIDINVRLSN